MAEGNRGLQDLLASLSPASNRSIRQENIISSTPAAGNEANDNNNNSNNHNAAMSSSVPKRTPSELSTQSANLLNLLRFNSSSASSANPLPTTAGTDTATAAGQQSRNQNIHGRGVSSSDLVASFMGKPTISQSAGNATPASMPDVASSGGNPHDYLLQLLNRNSNSQGRVPTQKSTSSPVAESSAFQTLSTRSSSSKTELSQKESSREQAVRQNSPIRVFGSQASRETTPFQPEVQAARQKSPVRVFGSQASRETTPFQPEVSATKAIPTKKSEPSSMFNYVNPFEQLAATSPRNGRSGNTTPAKTAQSKPSSSLSQKATPATESSKSMLDANGNGILQSIEGSNDKAPTSKDRLAGLGAPSNDKATVAQALNKVGEQVNRQVEYALAQQQPDGDEEGDENIVESIEQQLQRAAIEIKEEIQGDEINTLSTLVSHEEAAAIKNVLDQAAAGNIDGHGSADDEGEESGKAEEDVEVPVYEFPLRPWVSIDIQGDKAPVLTFRDSSITDIARLKKDFDQVDRYLATASSNYIVYSLPKPGGFRIIRQEDGMDRQAFKETKDHVFNVAICNEAHNRKSKIHLETCIATAVSGRVYWVTLRKDGVDLVEQAEEFERNSLAFPPMPAHDDNTSGGQLKTRAKASSRHPDCFAIGRGKAIHIVYPLHIQRSGCVSNKGVVDVNKYLRNHSIKINTGKAGKDFTFSEDDTVIATLDKSGRLRLWDITDLAENAKDSIQGTSIELKDPTLSFATTSGSNKSWPTSVLFVDKPRAYIKGNAQRYIIVGLKQNHTLQLWDLGLGKAVQEINFPHEKESNGMCSIGYHHHSGIVVVGHPTRNSIYFIHLSAPKYNLLQVTESKYIQRIANQDPTLPTPESTAILSGVREYSFAAKGQLRSVEILPTTNDGSVDEERGLFELYVMHSKGVTCLSIRKSDLGWTDDNKVILSKNAEEEGYVTLKEMREINPHQPSETSSVSGGTITPSSVRAPAKAKKVIESTAKLEAQLNSLSINNPAAPDTPEKSERRPKKKRTATYTTEEASVPPPAPIPPISSESGTEKTTQPRDTPQIKKVKETMDSSSSPVADASPRADSRKPAVATDSDPAGLSPRIPIAELRGYLNDLRTTITNDYVAIDEESRKKQAEVLRLVSEQLATNVDKALQRIVTGIITQAVVPSIHTVTATTLRNEIPGWLEKELVRTLPSQLKLSVPEAVNKTISSPDVLEFMAEQITSKISNHVEKQFNNSLQNTIIPSFQTMILDMAQKKIQESENRINDQVRAINTQHEETQLKLNDLAAMIQRFGDTVVSMAEAQARFQAEYMSSTNGVSKVSGDGSSDTQVAHPVSTSPPQQASVEQLEMQAISGFMIAGNYEQGVIMWLQSKFQTEIFDELFVQYNPSFLRGCSSLVALSVVAAVTISLENNVAQRLQWLEIILDFVDLSDKDIREVAPRIMDVLCQRLESRFMDLSELEPTNPNLRRFPPITRRARDLAKQCVRRGS